MSTDEPFGLTPEQIRIVLPIVRQQAKVRRDETAKYVRTFGDRMTVTVERENQIRDTEAEAIEKLVETIEKGFVSA